MDDVVLCARTENLTQTDGRVPGLAQPPGAARRGRRRGFTLVELLTVIAIMVMLAAILLPVLSRAQEQARRTHCMSNLHQIAIALKQYKLDEGGYPIDLTGELKRTWVTGERWFGPVDSTGQPTRASAGYGLATLFPDYVSSLKNFNCPDNLVRSIRDPANPGTTATKCYNSYDGYDPLVGASEGSSDATLAGLKYRRYWRATPASGTTDPQYRRQLCWRYPPDDTVITWCSHHRKVSDPTSPNAKDLDKQAGGQDIVLCLDGSAKAVPIGNQGAGYGSGHEYMPGGTQ